jgi:hypothetical protein
LLVVIPHRGIGDVGLGFGADDEPVGHQ